MNSADPGSLVDGECSVPAPGELLIATTEQELTLRSWMSISSYAMLSEMRNLLHARRTSQTITRMTIIVPAKPIPNIVPPIGHVGIKGTHADMVGLDPGFRLSKTNHQTVEFSTSMG